MLLKTSPWGTFACAGEALKRSRVATTSQMSAAEVTGMRLPSEAKSVKLLASASASTDRLVKVTCPLLQVWDVVPARVMLPDWTARVPVW